MKKLFVFADVHSFYDELMEALDQAGFDINNKDHIVVSLGDLCDRGPGSKEVLSFINSVPEDRKLCVIGNHEMMMELMIRRGYAEIADRINGTFDTVAEISDNGEIASLRNNEYWNEYKKSWHWYYEIGDYIFVHGWIPFDYDRVRYDPDWRESGIKELYDATWENGMLAWSKGIREKGKTIFCGHCHTSWGHCRLHHDGVEFPDEDHPERYARFDPFIDEGIVALDACTAYSHQVNVYTLDIDMDITAEC